MEAASNQANALKAMQSEVLLREHAELAEERRRLAERVASAEAALRAERAELESEKDRLQRQRQQRDADEALISANITKQAQRLFAAEEAIHGATAGPGTASAGLSPDTPASPITGDSAANVTTGSAASVSPEKVVQTAALLLAQQLLQPLRQQQSVGSLPQPLPLAEDGTRTSVHPPTSKISAETNLEAAGGNESFEAMSPPKRQAPEVPESGSRGRTTASGGSGSSKSREWSPFARRHRRHPDSSVRVSQDTVVGKGTEKVPSEKGDDDTVSLEAPTPLAVHASMPLSSTVTPLRHDQHGEDIDPAPPSSARTTGTQRSKSSPSPPSSKSARPLSPPIISKVSQQQQQQRTREEEHRGDSSFESVDSLVGGLPAGVASSSLGEAAAEANSRPTPISSPTSHPAITESELWRQRMQEVQEQKQKQQQQVGQSMTWVSSASSAFSSTSSAKESKKDARARMKAYDDRHRSALLGKSVGTALDERTAGDGGDENEDGAVTHDDGGDVTDDTASAKAASVLQAAFQQPGPKFKFLKKRPPKPLGQTGRVRKVKGSTSQSESVARLYGQHFKTRSKIEEARLEYVYTAFIWLCQIGRCTKITFWLSDSILDCVSPSKNKKIGKSGKRKPNCSSQI